MQLSLLSSMRCADLSRFGSSPVFIDVQDKESKATAHGWLTGAADRRLFSSPGGSQIRPQVSGNCDRAAMWLPATETQSADQTSVFHAQTQPHTNTRTGSQVARDKRKPGLHLSHYNDALGCVTLNLCVCVYACVSYFLSSEVSTQGVISDSPTSRDSSATWRRTGDQQRESMKLSESGL